MIFRRHTQIRPRGIGIRGIHFSWLEQDNKAGCFPAEIFNFSVAALP